MNKKILTKIEKLTKANVNIGYYDHLRHEEAKRKRNEINAELFFGAFKKTRFNNELRARHKNDLDCLLSNFIKEYGKNDTR